MPRVSKKPVASEFWLDSDDSDGGDYPVDRAKTPPGTPPPPPRVAVAKTQKMKKKSKSRVEAPVAATRTFLDDPLLPHTVDEPILDRLRDFVLQHGGYDDESAQAVATLLMAMLTTRTTNYHDLASLQKYLRSACPGVHAFLRDKVLRPELYPHADKDYPMVCFRAAREFADLCKGAN